MNPVEYGLVFFFAVFVGTCSYQMNNRVEDETKIERQKVDNCLALCVRGVESYTSSQCKCRS